ncbi:hypothetical protein GIS00_24345 [Nakamurella sp. YIM 132087]|uniref:DUF2568 domain-containing protein n=1 Tax=Nakamurella alba TaxID=2665158 RepID=A0A7K1FSF2_9ACTN|nr:hypothetical protein [Nakamurella alba]MTD17071.1 hypothetical protein [Nakamurella alba]
MEWWRWAAAGVELLLLVVLVLLRFDSLRDRPGWSMARAARRASIWAVLIPIGVAAVLLVPGWAVLVLLAVPALVIGTMAMAS